MARVLITGVSGHIGRHVASRLTSSFDVYGVARSIPPELPSLVKGLQADLLDHSQVSELLRDLRPEYLLHLAWQEYGPNYLSSSAHRTWQAASNHLFEAFCRHGGRRAVFAGSFYEQALPDTEYSRAKAALRDQVLSAGSRRGASAAWCRVFGTYGPYDRPQKFIPSAILSRINGSEFRVVDLDARWDYLHVEDVSRALVATMDAPFNGVVDVASGYSIALGDLYSAIQRRFNVGEDHRTMIDASKLRPTEPAIGRELAERIGWRPSLDLDTGLRLTIEWYRRAYAIY